MPNLQVEIVDRKVLSGAVRILGTDKITPEVLVEASDICLENYRACNDENKLTWYNYHEIMAKLVNNDVCPDEGVSVLGGILAESVQIPEPGRRVIVKKGAPVNSYHSKHDSGPKESVRKQMVRVDHVIGGFIDSYEGYRAVAPQVRWAGAGGYWHWTSPEYVEFNQ